MSGSVVNIKTSIVDFLTKKNINTEKLIAVECNGTNINTSQKGGAIRLLEE